MKFLFIRKDITQVPTDSQFIRNVEEKGGHIADKVRFPGVFSVSSIGLPIGSDQPRKVRKDDVRRCSNSERTTPVWADRCDRVVYAPCDTCVLQGAPTGDEGVYPVKIHPTVALNTSGGRRDSKRRQGTPGLYSIVSELQNDFPMLSMTDCVRVLQTEQ